MTLWTTEMIDVLKAEVAESTVSAAGMATILNREFNIHLTRNAVIGRMHRLGLCSKRKVRHNTIPKPKRPRVERKSHHVITSKLVQLPPIKPEPVIIVDDAMPRTDLIGLFDLKPTSCCWPYGDGPFLFCGLTVCEGDSRNSYCVGHTLRAYQKLAPRTDTRPFRRAA